MSSALQRSKSDYLLLCRRLRLTSFQVYITDINRSIYQKVVAWKPYISPARMSSRANKVVQLQRD